MAEQMDVNDAINAVLKYEEIRLKARRALIKYINQSGMKPVKQYRWLKDRELADIAARIRKSKMGPPIVIR